MIFIQYFAALAMTAVSYMGFLYLISDKNNFSESDFLKKYLRSLFFLPLGEVVRWSHIVGQSGSEVKVYSVVWSCCQNPAYHILLLLCSLTRYTRRTSPKCKWLSNSCELSYIERGD